MGDSDVSEPLGRNSVVLLKDGSVARRWCSHTAPTPWICYPATTGGLSVFEPPPHAASWEALLEGGIERVLHSAPPSKEDSP